LHVYVYMVTYIHRESTRGCVKISVHTPSVYMHACNYLRLWAQSSNIHVGVYVFTCRHAEFGCGMYVRIYLRSLYGCVYTIVCLRLYVYVYTHGVYKCVCIYSRIYIQHLYVCVCIYAYVHRFYMCVCMDLRIWTPRLHVCVYISTYIIQSLHVCVCTFAYRYTDLTCVFVHF